MFLRTKLKSATIMLGLLTALGTVVQAQQPSTQDPAEGPGRIGRGEGRGFHRGSGPGGDFGLRLLRETESNRRSEATGSHDRPAEFR
jgi:hypothetical protein